MSSSIYDPFVVTQVPRVKFNSNNVCSIAKVSSPLTSTFDIGISGSYLGTFVTRPSPKMILSYSLPPQAIVNTLDSYSFHNQDDQRLFAVSITQRNKFSLKFVLYGKKQIKEDSSEDNEKESVSIVNAEDHESISSSGNDQRTEETLHLDSEIISLKLSSKGERLYTVSKNGLITIRSILITENGEIKSSIISEFESSSINTKQNLLFNEFFNPDQVHLDKNKSLDSALIIVEKISQANIAIKAYAFDKENILEITNSTLSLSDNNKDTIISYDPSGRLIILTNQVLHTYSFPYPNLVKSFDISSVFSNESIESPVSMLAASPNRMLITKGSSIALIDVKYGALLGSLDLYSKSKEPGSVKASRTATLLHSPIVSGTAMKKKKTFALVLVKSTKDDSALIQHVTIDVGLGRLRNVLGKGLPSVSVNNSSELSNFELTGLPSLVPKPKFKNSLTESSDLVNKGIELSKETTEKFGQLEKLKTDNKLDEFESILLAYLKNCSIEELSKDSEQEFKVFEVDKDKVIDPRFIKKIISLLFDKDPVLQVSNDSFLPEKALTYFLTHPLFPSEYASGLLNALSDYPRLMRQAIVTCTGIPCIDLIEQLSLVDNDDIFKDLIARLVEEFSGEHITEATIKLIKKSSSGNISDIDLDKIINKILQLNYGYEILNSFIDTNGLVLSLHYSKNESQLLKLIEKTQKKVDCMTIDSQLLTLAKQVLLVSEKECSKEKKLKKKLRNKKFSDQHIDSHIEVETSKLDMIMNISGASSKFIKETESPNNKVPTYSIEKLVI